MNRKRKKPIATRKVTAAWLACMSLFIVELFFYTWCRVQYTRMGYEVTSAKDSALELHAKQNSLITELQRLKSPERIAKIAEQYLGLALPVPEQTVKIQ